MSSRFRFLPVSKVQEIPRACGVYCFQNKKKENLYIGKAKDLKERVKNHFQQPTPKDVMFLRDTTRVGYKETDSEIEALLEEARLIKARAPKYNTLWRDDKNYFFVGMTKEEFPRVFLTHQRSAYALKDKAEYIGPFIEGRALKRVLSLLRRTFPYYTAKSSHPPRKCPWCHLDLCPGPAPDKKEYRESMRHLAAILRGKNRSVRSLLKKKMEKAASSRQFEEAARIRDQIISLDHIFSHARVLEREMPASPKPSWKRIEKELASLLGISSLFRMEAYDISNIQGKEATGSMVVFVEGKPAPHLYRKFKIRLPQRPNDVAMLKEVLSRRLRHSEWQEPDAMLIDGGKGQLGAAVETVRPVLPRCALMALAKRENELFVPERSSPFLLSHMSPPAAHVLLYMRDEAHRFAKGYHSRLREKKMRTPSTE